MQHTSFFDRINNWLRNSITIRLATITFFILLLLIPLGMIRDLIRERGYARDKATREINSMWGNSQMLSGPVLTVPYSKYYYNKTNDKTTRVIKYAHFLPDDLNISGEIIPETRYRGIYNVVVYKSDLNFKGSFKHPNFSDWDISEDDIMWEDAFVSVGIPDMRGISESINLKWNESSFAFEPSIITKDVHSTGVSIKVPVDTTNKDFYNFSFNLALNGSESLSFIPMGKQTSVKLTSPWKDPSFYGDFLAIKREITDNGFNAEWKVLQLNRNFPQQWLGNKYNIETSEFGVRLILPVDEYQKTMRSAKYAIMFISLTFLIFFFIEVLSKVKIHPIQYILVGLALCIFYSMLLSITEHFNFNIAYIISSSTIILLITAYTRSIFKQPKLVLIMGGVLTILYIFLFTLLQLQDYALLMGNIGLLLTLSIVMYLSRNINWYSISKSKAKPDISEDSIDND